MMPKPRVFFQIGATYPPNLAKEFRATARVVDGSEIRAAVVRVAVDIAHLHSEAFDELSLLQEMAFAAKALALDPSAPPGEGETILRGDDTTLMAEEFSRLEVKLNPPRWLR